MALTGASRARVVVGAQQHVHRRHDEQREQRADRHAGEDHQPHRVSAPAAPAPVGDHQRHDAEHHRGGRHQDRPQAHAGGLLDRLRAWSCPRPAAGSRTATIRMPCLLMSPISVTRPDLRVDVERAAKPEVDERPARRTAPSAPRPG